jgi:hypothetical protein
LRFNKFVGQFGLRKIIIAYVKNESFSLNAMTFTLKIVVNYETLGLQESFNGTCFWHDFFKAYQYATINEFFCRNLKNVSINTTKVDF